MRSEAGAGGAPLEREDLIKRMVECFLELHRTLKKTRSFFGLPHHWVMAMNFLYEAGQENGNASLKTSELAEQLKISRPFATQLLDDLADNGLIKRELTAEDRRLVYAVLTEEGERSLKEWKRRSMEVFDQVLDRFGQNNLVEMMGLIERFAECYNGAAAEAEKAPMLFEKREKN